ncbi:MAG: hypothetical protein ACKPKO_09105, partial [Candidatus Fonsibacter sp.]
MKAEKWRLEPALKRARLHDRNVTMDDGKKWRVENYNLEKRPRSSTPGSPTDNLRNSKWTFS